MAASARQPRWGHSLKPLGDFRVSLCLLWLFTYAGVAGCQTTVPTDRLRLDQGMIGPRSAGPSSSQSEGIKELVKFMAEESLASRESGQGIVGGWCREAVRGCVKGR